MSPPTHARAEPQGWWAGQMDCRRLLQKGHQDLESGMVAEWGQNCFLSLATTEPLPEWSRAAHGQSAFP